MVSKVWRDEAPRLYPGRGRAVFSSFWAPTVGWLVEELTRCVQVWCMVAGYTCLTFDKLGGHLVVSRFDLICGIIGKSINKHFACVEYREQQLGFLPPGHLEKTHVPQNHSFQPLSGPQYYQSFASHYKSSIRSLFLFIR